MGGKGGRGRKGWKVSACGRTGAPSAAAALGWRAGAPNAAAALGWRAEPRPWKAEARRQFAPGVEPRRQ